MVLVGEIFGCLSLVAIAFPYLLQLEHAHRLKQPSGIASYIWRAWAVGFLLVGVYFASHPRPVHNHRKHQVTDVVEFPHAYIYGFPLCALLVYACRFHDKYLQEFPVQGPRSLQARTLAQWVLIPVIVSAAAYAVAYGLRQLVRLNSRYFLLMEIVGVVGAVVFDAAMGMASFRPKAILTGPTVVMNHLTVLVQLLGFMVAIQALLLIYKTVDFGAVLQLSLMGVGCFALALSRWWAKSEQYQTVETV